MCEFLLLYNQTLHGFDKATKSSLVYIEHLVRVNIYLTNGQTFHNLLQSPKSQLHLYNSKQHRNNLLWVSFQQFAVPGLSLFLIIGYFLTALLLILLTRSEERRVGNEFRS